MFGGSHKAILEEHESDYKRSGYSMRFHWFQYVYVILINKLDQDIKY